GAPSCATLAEAVRTTSIAIAGGGSDRAITAQAGAGSVVAWAGQDGKIHITPLDAEDQRAGDDILVDGSQVFGAVASASDVALLVSRPPDFMTFVRVDMKGAELAKTDLVGGGNHMEVGVEWFGEFAQTGRLAAQKDGTYAAYHALHRRWPDMVGHQGDTLRLLDASGGALGGGWGWGCSHSMDQRLASGPNGLVPICISDCYPGKGIYFNHQSAEITTDPAANCAGGYSTELGGLTAVDAGFFLVYKDAQGGAHLGAFDTSGKSLSDRALSVEGSSRLARYGGGMLLGSQGGGGTSLQELDAAGQDVGAPATIAAPLPDQDFEGRSDGEVAWAAVSGANLTVVRVRVCQK
ncbi:MAG: hypothetical protein HUU21_39470, partial [Polyangiaceae bacterium]|nr:hypothetical protein [Polyangiaceae bacterium]